MKNILPTLLPTTRLLLIASTVLPLSGCFDKKPQDAGREMAEMICEREADKDDAEYKRDETLLAELQNKKITSDQQFQARRDELQRPIKREDSISFTKMKALETQYEIDFPKEDDRKTIRNAAEANYKQCRTEREAKIKDRKDVETEMHTLVMKLMDEENAKLK